MSSVFEVNVGFSYNLYGTRFFNGVNVVVQGCQVINYLFLLLFFIFSMKFMCLIQVFVSHWSHFVFVKSIVRQHVSSSLNLIFQLSMVNQYVHQ